MVEQWKPCPGWGGWYEVSDHGNVRGVDRQSARADGSVQTWRGRALRPSANGGGYLVVRLSRPGLRATARVHRLVAEAFLPKGHTAETVNHKDGRKANNRADNLEWATRAENTRHAIECGLGNYLPPVKHGEAGNASKLTQAIVEECRRRRRNGESYRSLAREYGVNHKTMREAISGVTWAAPPAPDEQNPIPTTKGEKL